MHLRVNIVLLLHTIAVFSIQITFAEETNSQNSVWQKAKDDIYIDDDALEGSGRDEVRNDLEASGSGYGPDDEDAEGGSGAVSIINSNNNNKTPKTNNHPSKEPDFGKEREPEVTKENQNNVEQVIPNNGIGGTDTDSNADLDSSNHNDVYIMNAKPEDRPTSFFAQPGILAAVIGGAVVGLLCAILVVMFIVYRMRKKDEGSYALEEPKRSPTANSYSKNSNREFYA